MSTASAQIAATSTRQSYWLGTPEIYFRKNIDNSRLVKVEDPRRSREMRQFGLALSFLFLLVMGYALQHFRAIEYGYKIEALRAENVESREMNRALRLEDASLRSPARIDEMARKLGLQSPQPGQVQRIDADGDSASPVMASAATGAAIPAE